jgi:hypothetical protein
MRLARPREVPATCAVSGIVFVLAWFYMGRVSSWRIEVVIFGAWGLLYLGEWAWRSITGRTARPVSVEGDAQS